MAAIVLFSLPIGAVTSYLRGGILDAASVSVFIISLYLMFQTSTLYHAMAHDSVHKAVFKILDHIFIYVAIAGSYTPVALCVIGGWQGVLILVIQWAMVLFGILYKSLSRQSLPKVSLTIYLVMGWTVVLFLPTFLSHAHPHGRRWCTILRWGLLLCPQRLQIPPYGLASICQSGSAFSFCRNRILLKVNLGRL